MYNMLDHYREELEEITPYVCSRPKILRWLDTESKIIQMVICQPAILPQWLLLSFPIQCIFSQLLLLFQFQMKHGFRKQYTNSEL